MYLARLAAEQALFTLLGRDATEEEIGAYLIKYVKYEPVPTAATSKPVASSAFSTAIAKLRAIVADPNTTLQERARARRTLAADATPAPAAKRATRATSSTTTREITEERKEPNVRPNEKKNTTLAKGAPQRQQTALNASRTVQTFKVAETAREGRHANFVAKQNALTAVAAAELRLGVCEENVRTFLALGEARSDELAHATSVATAHVDIAASARSRAGERPTPANLAAARDAEAQANAKREALREMGVALEQTVKNLKSAISAKDGAKRDLEARRAEHAKL